MSTHPLIPIDSAAPPREPPILIGLIGGVASGKSTVARALAEFGALWLDCDKIAHQVLQQGDIVRELQAKFANGVVDAQGIVDRRRLASIVFGDDPAALARRRTLEALVHPRVRSVVEQRIQEAGNRYPAIVIDAPLLIEAGWGELCDRVLLVDTPIAMRERLAAQRGWSQAEFAKRERSQMPLADKRRHATDTIVNDRSLEALNAQVARFWQTLHAS